MESKDDWTRTKRWEISARCPNVLKLYRCDKIIYREALLECDVACWFYSHAVVVSRFLAVQETRSLETKKMLFFSNFLGVFVFLAGHRFNNTLGLNNFWNEDSPTNDLICVKLSNLRNTLYNLQLWDLICTTECNFYRDLNRNFTSTQCNSYEIPRSNLRKIPPQRGITFIAISANVLNFSQRKVQKVLSCEKHQRQSGTSIDVSND